MLPPPSNSLIYAYTCIHVCVYMHFFSHIHTSVYICIFFHAYTRMCIYDFFFSICIRSAYCLYTHTHSYCLYTHTHLRIQLVPMHFPQFFSFFFFSICIRSAYCLYTHTFMYRTSYTHVSMHFCSFFFFFSVIVRGPRKRGAFPALNWLRKNLLQHRGYFVPRYFFFP